MATTRFPLYRLPFLALYIVLDFFGLNDIIKLSLCSRRSLRVAKKCWKKKEILKAELSVHIIPSVRLYFNTRLSYRIFISRAQNVQDLQVNNIRVGDAVVPSIHMETRIVTFWEDKIRGIGRFVSFIKDLFDVPIDSITLEAEEHPNEFIHIFDCIMSRQESVEKCTFRVRNSIDECLTHLLDNCKTPRNIRFRRGPTSQFSHTWNIHLDGLHVSNGSSFTIQNLMSINCKSLELPHSSLTSEDMNQFLKHWQEGGSPHLKFLWTEMNSIDQEIITLGFDTVSQPQGLHRYYEFVKKSKFGRYGGIDIRRNDGTTGSIFLNGNRFEFGVDPTLTLD